MFEAVVMNGKHKTKLSEHKDEIMGKIAEFVS
jgi:hypothetical protein